ncbi:hypothetical protein HMPREF9005_1166, partial [Actinomyces sp. oral taxon 178 str. F0338]
MRGKLKGDQAVAARRGLIPACAGKTGRRPRAPLRRSAHPRVCGENPSSGRQFPPVRGSSPRVRGKPAPASSVLSRAGLIPACAGKTRARAPPRRRRRAHPRVCGENQAAAHGRDAVGGSSPRVRGKRDMLRSLMPRFRLIPACAGKTLDGAQEVGETGAHPRVCGENVLVSGGEWVAAGSSPRVRGKHPLDAGGAASAGLIPACAGKTRRALWPWGWTTAHPRVCGENVALGHQHVLGLSRV